MTDFADLGLSADLLKAVSDAGYTAPTPIQAQAIPYVLMGRDVLGCAQTGTGKTASFTLPMLDILASGRARARMPRTLILEPTRELAAQVAASFETYGKHSKLSMALLIGGESFADQERKLDRGVDVLIATPGRLMDLFDRGKILLSDVRILVIDEADRMLDMGFIPDIERIVSMLPKIRQTLFFSATMPPEIRRLADAFLTNPREISVAPPATTAVNVTAYLSTVWGEDKRALLRHLIQAEDVKNAIIFCNRKRDVDILFRSLQKHGLDVVALHGDMPQSKRTETLERFKSNTVRLLVASDVAARGLDVQGLSHVFNFDVPIHAEDYVHRIGRTGRAGNTGRAFTFATPDDGRLVAAIEKLTGKPITVMTVDGFEHPDYAPDEPGARRGRGRGKSTRTSRPTPAPATAPVAEAAAAAEAGEDVRAERSSERPRRERGDRRRDRDRSGDRPAERPSERPAERLAERDRATERDRPSERGERDSERNRPAAIQMGVARPQYEPRGRYRRDDEDDERVVGFGDHLPAFLARPVPLPGRNRAANESRAPAPALEAESDDESLSSPAA